MGQITRPAFRVLGVFFPTLGRVSADFRLQLFQPFTLTANFAISVAVVNFGEFLAQQSRQQIGPNLSIQQEFALQLGLTFTQADPNVTATCNIHAGRNDDGVQTQWLSA